MTETASTTTGKTTEAPAAAATAGGAGAAAVTATTTPEPLDEQPASSPCEGEDSSKPTPALSPSTWKPNAAAAEWTPSFGAPAAPAAKAAGEGGGQEETAEEGEVPAGEKDVGDTPESKATPSEDSAATTGGDVAGKSDAATGDAAETTEAGATIRYDIAFLVSLRPKPEGTPRPEGLNPPDRVDILWDGKEPTPMKAGSMRGGGIRPLPPLGGRMGRGLGEARGAPPPLRGAQLDMGRDRDNRMDQRGGRDDRRSGGGGGGGRDNRGGGGRRPPVDTAPALEDCKPIEINEATRWKPKSLETKGKAGDAEDKLPTEEVLMKANAILNKASDDDDDDDDDAMTLEKFAKLSVTFMDVGLRDPEVVSGVIDIIVEKAQMEPHFSSMYADLCARIARTPIAGLGEDATGKDASKGSKKFRKLLLVKVQQEFEKDWQGLFAAVQSDSNLADDEKAEKEFGLKRKYTGHMRFVGELYKVELLKEKHVHAAIHDMFGNADEPDEERLECMVKLLQTCGKKLDQTGSPDIVKDMKRLFKRVGKVADGRQVSSRIRFMLRDLIELRKNHWVPRREEEKAKTMQELHNDIAKEEESKNRRGGASSRPGGSSGSSSIRPGSGDARVSMGSRGESTSTGSRPTGLAVAPKKDDDGWETVPKKGGKGGGGGGDGWSQVSSSRSRSSNPGSDERRGGSSANGSLVAQQSAFALLSSHDDDKEKEKKKKKKDSKDKKEKSSKSGKEKKKKSSNSKKTSTAA
ncbi:unnamed protein product, partial [Ectocarpus fasciculatus]